MFEPVKIQFGALSPPLAEQPVGKLLNAHDLDHFQQDADAISRLYIRRVITKAQTDAARYRLLKQMEKSARKTWENGL